MLPPQTNSQPRIRLRNGPGNGASKQKKVKGTNPSPHHTRIALRKQSVTSSSNNGFKKGQGAPLGNQNYFHGKIVKQAFINALQKRGRGDTLAALEKIADRLIRLALKGGVPAAREMFDRLEGKPAQMIMGDVENPLVVRQEISVDERATRLLQLLALKGVFSGSVPCTITVPQQKELIVKRGNNGGS